MLVKAHSAPQQLRRLNPAIRFFLFGGPDDSMACALRDQTVAAIGPDAERVDVSVATIQSTPSILADEAASISLFGGRRWVSVTIPSGSGDELASAVDNLLMTQAGDCPVIATVAGLTARSRLVKLAEKDDRVFAVICYAATARELGPLVDGIARPLGLTLDADVVRALGQATGNDRGLIASEIEKLALYVDATPDQPQRATMSDWLAIGAEVDDADLSPAINAAFGGRLTALPTALAELAAQDALDIRLVRALMARAQLIARLRVGIEGGQSIDQVMANQGRGIFWKERAAVEAQVSRWPALRIARAISRLHGLERALKTPDNAGPLLVRDALLGFARAAAQGGRAPA